jgi:hypothetical protein
MKTILILSAALFSTFAQATPVVGDLVRYKMTTSVGPQNQIMEQRVEVTSVNPSAGTFTTKTTITFNGTTVSQESETADMNSATESESTLDHCSEMPADMASIETITVPAGTFKVCHIKMEQDGNKLDQYMGRVMFGLVKSVTTITAAHQTITLELIEARKH